MTRTKKDGVVYTPEWVVDLILDEVECHLAFGQQSIIVDPSCGEGAFLAGAVSRIARRMLDKGDSGELIRAWMQERIIGIDVDRSALNNCHIRLNQLLADQGIGPVEWSLHHQDALLGGPLRDELQGAVSHVIGNPPYIRIQDLDSEYRKYLQETWTFCRKGSTDIYFAFFQLGMLFLRPEGVLGFITPRSYFDSAAAQDFRRSVTSEHRLLGVVDFGDQQVFEEVSTYTAITLLSGSSLEDEQRVSVSYVSVASRQEEWGDARPSSDFGAPRWNLVRNSDAAFIHQVESRGISLVEACRVRVGLATLRDKIYTVRLVDGGVSLNPDELVWVDSAYSPPFEIESGALRRALKASTVKFDNQDQGLAVIFPYELSPEGRAIPWSESTCLRFTRAMSYLESHRPALEGRGHEVRSWFEYGSTQGIETLFNPKILVPPMTLEGDLYLSEFAGWTFFSGYGIFFDGNLGRLHQRLREDDFRRYSRLVGRALRGGWYSMTKSSISGFSLTHEEWDELGLDLSQFPLRLFG